MVFILILMVDHIKDNGQMVSSMAKERLLHRKENPGREFGKMVKELDGLIKKLIDQMNNDRSKYYTLYFCYNIKYTIFFIIIDLFFCKYFS